MLITLLAYSYEKDAPTAEKFGPSDLFLVSYHLVLHSKGGFYLQIGKKRKRISCLESNFK
jgi:hypothetical protein